MTKKRYKIFFKMREAESGDRILHREEAMPMSLEICYIAVIYILFILLSIVIAFALYIALIAVISKLDKYEKTSLPDR